MDAAASTALIRTSSEFPSSLNAHAMANNETFENGFFLLMVASRNLDFVAWLEGDLLPSAGNLKEARIPVQHNTSLQLEFY
jgi:hypothetical protein